MKNSNNNPTLIDFKLERNKRIHDIHEKNVQDINNAFEKAFPLTAHKKKNKHKTHKKKF